jgi:methylmalonyl-CoA/ethylmalonyl-CoA epimerase
MVGGRCYELKRVEMNMDVFAWKPHHCGISVANLQDSIRWYADFLGFELEKTQFIAQIPAQVAFIKRGDFRIELLQLEHAKALPSERKEPNLDLQTHGHKHLCLAVENGEHAFAELRAKQADIVFEAVIEGTAMGFLRDNDGNLIELIEYPALWNDEGTAQ